MDLIKTKKTAEQRYSEQLEANALASLHQAASAETRKRLGLELIEYCGTMISIASKLPDATELLSDGASCRYAFVFSGIALVVSVPGRQALSAAPEYVC